MGSNYFGTTQNDQYSSPRNMASALGNFKMQQGQLGALQAGSTGSPQMQASANAPPTSPATQGRDDPAYLDFVMKNQMYADEARKADDAHKKQLADSIAAAQASATSAMSATNTKDSLENKSKLMQQIMQDNKHPLGVLAAGILGWKMRKENKAMLSEQAQALQLQAQSDASKLQAEELLKRRDKAQNIVDTKEVPSPTNAANEELYNRAVARGVKPEDMTIAERAGMIHSQNRRKDAEAQGGLGAPVGTVLENANQKTVVANKVQNELLGNALSLADPRFFTLGGVVQGKVGSAIEFISGKDNKWAEIEEKRRGWEINMAAYKNEVIHARAGTAVSSHEQGRMDQELFGAKYTTEDEFIAAMVQNINNNIAINSRLVREGGHRYDEKTGTWIPEKGAPARPDVPIPDDVYVTVGDIKAAFGNAYKSLEERQSGQTSANPNIPPPRGTAPPPETTPTSQARTATTTPATADAPATTRPASATATIEEVREMIRNNPNAAEQIKKIAAEQGLNVNDL